MHWSISHSPPNEYLGVISFRIDWFSPLAVPCSSKHFQEPSPGLQFESINSSVLSLFYGPTLTSVHDYRKNHSFDYTDLVGKKRPLIFNMLSRIVIAFLPRNKHLLISWLQSSSAKILSPRKQNLLLLPMLPLLFITKWWDQMPWSSFSECCVSNQLFNFPGEWK